MPIIEHKNSLKINAAVNPVKTNSEDYRSITVDDKFSDVKSLAAYVEGYTFTVEAYYSQIVGNSNDVREIDLSQSKVYQQYNKINNLNIKIENPLDFSYDENDSLGTITGSAHILPGLIPNNFDYILCKTTRGKPTLLRITGVSRRSMNRDTVHTVGYQLVGYTDVPGLAKDQLNNLNEKVNAEYFYHEDRYARNNNAILKETEHNQINLIKKFNHQFTRYYFQTFLNINYGTLVIPGQDKVIYDSLLTDLVLKISSVYNEPLVLKTKQFSIDQDIHLQQPNLIKALLERDSVYVRQANRCMGIVNRRNLKQSTWLAGFGILSLDYFVYPVNPDTSALISKDVRVKMPSNEKLEQRDHHGIGYDYQADYNLTNGVSLFKPYNTNETYILSPNFYNEDSNLCVLESLVWSYLNGDSLNLSLLSKCCSLFEKLNRLEQFYYGPILFLLNLSLEQDIQT